MSILCCCCCFSLVSFQFLFYVCVYVCLLESIIISKLLHWCTHEKSVFVQKKKIDYWTTLWKDECWINAQQIVLYIQLIFVYKNRNKVIKVKWWIKTGCSGTMLENMYIYMNVYYQQRNSLDVANTHSQTRLKQILKN